MAVNVQHQELVNCMGFNVQVNRDASADGFVGGNPTIARAKVGTLSTRTDNDTGVLTLETGHGVTTAVANKLDMYWDGGKRVGVTVGSVSGLSVPVDGGSGDNLPDADTVVTAMVPQSEDFAVDGDDLVAILATSGTRATIKVIDDAPSTALTIAVESQTEGYVWNSTQGTTNPVAGDTLVSVLLSHDDGVNSQSVGILGVKV